MQEIWAKIVAKCWSDPEFKQQLMQNPRSVLEAQGITLPEGANVDVLEQTPTQYYFLLPATPTQGELSESELETIAAGNCSSPCCGIID